MALKYKWLTEKLKEQIPKWTAKGITKLPTEAEIGEKYKVSRQTVRQSLALLEEQGIIEKRQGSGSYITGRKEDSRYNTIAILITTVEDYIYPQLLLDLQNALAQYGFSSKIYVTDNRTDKEREILQELLANAIPPVAIISEGCKAALPNPNLDLYRRLSTQKIPVLFLHNYYPGLEQAIYIKDDNYQGAAELVTYLKTLGHTKIAGIFPSDDIQGLERYRGFVETMRSFELPINDDYIVWFHRSDLLGIEKRQDTDFLRNAIQSVLQAKEGRLCTAVVCYNDEIAYYLIRELQKQNISVPEEVAIVSFDNSYLATAGKTTITSMGHDQHDMGQTAADMIVSMIKGTLPHSREIAWSIKIRASS